jgi:hypothetical protein
MISFNFFPFPADEGFDKGNAFGSAMMKRRIDRKVRRYLARLAVRELNGQPAPDTYLLDISSLGARLESKVFFPIRAPLAFSVMFPGMEEETRLSGLVAWMRPVLGQTGYFQVGVRFYKAFWNLDRLARLGDFGAAWLDSRKKSVF